MSVWASYEKAPLYLEGRKSRLLRSLTSGFHPLLVVSREDGICVSRYQQAEIYSGTCSQSGMDRMNGWSLYIQNHFLVWNQFHLFHRRDHTTWITQVHLAEFVLHEAQMLTTLFLWCLDALLSANSATEIFKTDVSLVFFSFYMLLLWIINVYHIFNSIINYSEKKFYSRRRLSGTAWELKKSATYSKVPLNWSEPDTQLTHSKSLINNVRQLWTSISLKLKLFTSVKIDFMMKMMMMMLIHVLNAFCT